jgi:His/Glu/Gln/Arg/opine family amino acid ABC transporter permease subunit|tara:strand:+ start:846 stop:1508 length:663 start_codon:yes stop_codon:yes gene_type:complete
MDFEFKWHVLLRYQSFLIDGVLITIQMALIGMAIALTLGLVIALMGKSGIKILVIFSDIYIQIFRAIPLFVYLIWMFYGAAMLTGINVPAFATAVICLSMTHSAFMAETYRAGIESVPKGHTEAGLSVGLSRFQVMRYIILPQAIRTILPPIGNEFVIVFKSTTILGIIGVDELVRKAQFATTLSFRPFELYSAVAVIFVIMVIIISRFNLFLERKFSYS